MSDSEPATAPRSPLRPGRVLLLVLLLVAMGEVALRVAAAITGEGPAPARGATSEALYVPKPYVGYGLRPGATSDPKRKRSYRINALGFRGAEIDRAKPAGTFRVACLGGSTTWGWDAWSDETTWPALLEGILRRDAREAERPTQVEVINAGVPGYTLMESFVNLKMRVLPLEPDLVIVYHAANDGRIIAREDPEPDYSHVRRPWTPPPPPGPLERALGWTYLWAHFGPDSGAGPVDLDAVLNVPGFDDRPPRPAEEIDDGLAIVRTTLREMNALARLHGATLVYATYAYSRDPHPNPRKQGWKDHQTAVIDRVNEVVREVAAAEGAPLLDLHELGPRSAEDFTDIIHLTDSGRKRMARVIARELAAAGLVPGS